MASIAHLHAIAEYVNVVRPQTKNAGAMTVNTFDAIGYDRIAFLMMLGTCKHAGSNITFSVWNATRGAGTYTLQTGTLHTAVAPGYANTAVYTLDVAVNKDRPYIKLLTTCSQ